MCEGREMSLEKILIFTFLMCYYEKQLHIRDPKSCSQAIKTLIIALFPLKSEGQGGQNEQSSGYLEVVGLVVVRVQRSEQS